MKAAQPDLPPSSAGARAPWILVLGTGQKTLSEKIYATADRLGAALAEKQFNLATFGWHGVDEVVARSFAKATGLSADELEHRLVHFIDGGGEPEFPSGWVTRFSTEADTVAGA